jgi:PEP-CTERM motif-containing protein
MNYACAVVSALFVLTASVPADALILGFAGPWAPATWTTSFVGDVAPPGPADNGTVNTSGAPNLITIVGGDDPANPNGLFNSCSGGGLFGCEVQFNHAALGKFISFAWSYTTVDSCGAQCDFFGVLLNGSEQILSDQGGLATQSGTFSTGNASLSTFGFFVSCGQDCAGGPATVVISAFSSEFSVPEPGSIALLGMGLAALALHRRKRV